VYSMLFDPFPLLNAPDQYEPHKRRDDVLRFRLQNIITD
jgi:hypothetical protein